MKNNALLSHNTDPVAPDSKRPTLRPVRAFVFSCILLAALLLHFSASSRRWHDPSRASSGALDLWLAQQTDVAWRGLLRNIGPAAGAREGLLIASPSTSQPDYFYTWTRDAALSYRPILSRFAAGDLALEPLLRSYVSSQAALQRTPNPSGTFANGLGLAEPKFQVDGSAFLASWGRPQADGPALRAATLTELAMILLDRNATFGYDYVKRELYSGHLPPRSVIKADLEYVAHNWHKDSFDLWEERSGQHFFTLLSSHRALTLGSTLAAALSDSGASAFYSGAAAQISDALERFWDPAAGRINAYACPACFRRSGIDAAVLLGALHSGGADGGKWAPGGERIGWTLEGLLDGFRGLYEVNGRGKGEDGKGILVGRYPEDVYNGTGNSQGNPWFLTTLAVAQTLYTAALDHLPSSSSLAAPPSPSSAFLPFTAPFRNTANSNKLKSARELKQRGDAFLEAVMRFAGEDGQLSEQIHRTTGEKVGARDLTWSYAALLTAAEARSKLLAALNAE